jgi:hypothetical protein
VRSLAILLAAAAVFLAYLVAAHTRANRALAGEEAALARLEELVRLGPRPELVEGGYRFAWLEGNDLPSLLVASPVRAGRDGVRWFATVDGTRIYEFDTVRYRAPAGAPRTDRLRFHVALDPADRERTRPPTGWLLRE